MPAARPALVMELAGTIAAAKIMTREALEDAIAAVCAIGGSTNAVLHLIAIAREMNLTLTMDDFDRICEKTPFICDLHRAASTSRRTTRMRADRACWPSGCWSADSCMTPTVTGKTIREEAAAADETPGQVVIHVGPATEAYRRARDPERQPRAGWLRGEGRRA